MIVGETDGLVKVVAEKLPDGTGGRIVGVHMAGPWVTEQLGQGYLAVELGSHRRRSCCVHPAPSDLERDVRRNGDGAYRPVTSLIAQHDRFGCAVVPARPNPTDPNNPHVETQEEHLHRG